MSSSLHISRSQISTPCSSFVHTGCVDEYSLDDDDVDDDSLNDDDDDDSLNDDDNSLNDDDDDDDDLLDSDLNDDDDINIINSIITIIFNPKGFSQRFLTKPE